MALTPHTGPPKWALLQLVSEHTKEASLRIEETVKELVSTEAPLNEVIEGLYAFFPSKLCTFQHEAATLRVLKQAWLKLDGERHHEDLVADLRRKRLQIFTDLQLDLIGSFVESALTNFTKRSDSSKARGVDWFFRSQLNLRREIVLTKLLKPEKSADLWLICDMGVIRTALDEVPLESIMEDHKNAKSLHEFLRKYPHIRAAFDVTNVTDESKIKAYIASLETVLEMTKLGLAFGSSVTWYKVSGANYLQLGEFLYRAALENGLPSMKRFVFHHNGRRLYSSHMKMTLTALGIRDGHILEVSERDFTYGDRVGNKKMLALENGENVDPKPLQPPGQSLLAIEYKEDRMVNQKEPKSGQPLLAIEYKCHDETKPAQFSKGSNRRCEKKKPTLYNSPEDEAKKLKQQHSRKLSRVFEEADPKFRLIREGLHAMNLQRAQPKVKCKSTKTLPSPALSNNLLLLNEAGSAGTVGRTSIAILVGEPGNLYKTGKRTASIRSACRTTIDLHGLTKEKALATLDRALPEWIDHAMKGSYPFVKCVEIVCGGGQQLLEGAVDSWIRRQRTVAKAPKGYLQRI